MPRRRRVQAIALLLVLLGAGGVYRLAHGDGPNPVLRTVTVGVTPGMVAVDTATNRVFVQNYDDQSVTVLNAHSGQLLHTVSSGDFVSFLVVDVPTNRVVVVSDDAPSDSVLDASSGTIVGTIRQPIFDAEVDPRNGHVFLTTQGGFGFGYTVTMLDGRDGAMLHSTNLPGTMRMDVVVDARANRVFVTNTGDNTVNTVDAGSGHLLRTVTVGSTPIDVAVDSLTGRVCAPNNGANTASVLDARTGALLRTLTVAPHPATAVVDEQTGRVFVMHGRGSTLGAYSSFVATFQQVGPVGVTMLDARTGVVLRTLSVGGSVGNDTVGWAPPTNIAVDMRRGRVFVIDRYDPGSAGDGRVGVLDAGSGELLRTIGVGRHPISLAVDEVTARRFVVNTKAGCLRPFSLWDRVPAAVRHVLPFLPAPARPTCHRLGTVTVIDTSRL
jgi:YVTN family beta-propeller protein